MSVSMSYIYTQKGRHEPNGLCRLFLFRKLDKVSNINVKRRFPMFLKVLFAVLLFAVGVFSQGAPAVLTTGVPETKLLWTSEIDGVLDTLHTAVDSMFVATNRTFPAGYDFILMKSALSASGDSVSLIVIVRNSYGETTNCDTILTEGAEEILLPINRTMNGDKFSILLKGITAKQAATGAVLGKIDILKRRLQSTSYSSDSKYR